MEKTQVIFRKWPKKEGGGIIALFPKIEHSHNLCRLCESYEHIGQHGGTDYHHVIRQTKPAKEAEYASLQKELESIGYTLDIRRRATA
jgi:hypothetical protein